MEEREKREMNPNLMAGVLLAMVLAICLTIYGVAALIIEGSC